MGKRYLRSTVSDFQTLTASADITPVDLPVNPLSHLILTIQGIQTTRATAGLYSYLHDFCAAVSDLSIRHRGENIIQGSLADIMMVNAFLSGYFPYGEKADGDVGKIRTMSFLISFARKPYIHDEAFPATSRGNLRFYMTAGALPASFSAVSWALEGVELIEDTPAQFLKYTTLTRLIAASGRQRMPLPVGNELLGLMMFDPTVVTGDTAAFNFGKIKIMKDNVEQYFAESNWESTFDAFGRRGAVPLQLGGHIHFAGQAIASEVEENEQNKSEVPRQYSYLDFDPLFDGSYSLDAHGVSSLDLDLNSDNAAGTVRVLPVELIQVGAK